MPTNQTPYYLSHKKLLFDMTLGILSIILSMPIWIFIAPIIFFTAGTPIIFKQKRAGKNKKTFTIYKFRTMKRDANNNQHELSHLNQAPEPMFKIFDDPRFVGIGQFLSKTGLDETPQFINILKGEMSFVGPRPLPINETKKLPKEWNFRYQVKPGLFSKWTLSKDRYKSLKKWKNLEMETLKIHSVHEDLLLIFKIVFQIIAKQFKS